MEFCDLKYQYSLYKDEILKRIDEVLNKTSFINGHEVKLLEQKISVFLDNDTEAIGCSSGTDALLVALMALGVKPGDEVIVPNYTFIATAEVVSLLNAVPVFCDVDPSTFLINVDMIENCITKKTVGIIPVSLFGQCADFDEIGKIADKYDLWIIEDGAQSFGASYKGRKSCALSSVATTSFFPAKPLGCYGDGGAIFSKDSMITGRIRSIINHGQSKRYIHTSIGINGRLDTLQAAVLLVKLDHFTYEIELRKKVAELYTKYLNSLVSTPTILPYNSSVWAQYTIKHILRDEIQASLNEVGIPTSIHYPIPLNSQEAFYYLPSKDLSFPASEKVSKEVLSLPMHPFVEEKNIEKIACVIRGIV